MIEYLRRHPEKVAGPLVEHIELVLITLAVSLTIASLLTLLSGKVSDVLNNIFSVVYSIPSLALFALLIPVTGLGRTSAIIVLTLYNQYILLKSFTTGLREVDPVVCEAAEGIGMTDMQILTKIRIPLARKAIFAGIRLAVVSTIGIGTIAASINAGGLGTLLFEGSILSAGLALLLNRVLKTVENRL